MRAAVVGVTGYSGTELFRILSNHPKIEEINLYAREKEGVSKRFLNKEVSAFRNIENELLSYGYYEIIEAMPDNMKNGIKSRLRLKKNWKHPAMDWLIFISPIRAILQIQGAMRRQRF